MFKEAFNAGWRVGDEILEVDGKKVRRFATASILSWIDVGKLCLLICCYELFDNVCWFSPVFSRKKQASIPFVSCCLLVPQEWKLAGSVQSCNTKCGTPCRGTEEASGELQGAAVGCA